MSRAAKETAYQFRDAYPSHHRDQEEENALPMASHVCFRQFNADRKHSNSKDDSGEFQCDHACCLL
jgi:hypothetical protein